MFRARLCAALGIGLMLAAASTEAREIQLSVETRIGGDSNVFRERDDKKADGYFALSPLLALNQRHSKLNYAFSYNPTYETYFKTSGIDGFDHRAKGDVEWQLTPVDTASVSASYTNTRRLRIEDQTSSGGSVPAPQESDRERLRYSNASLSYTRMLSPVLSLQTSANFDDFTSSSDTDLDSRAYSGQLGGQYALNPRTSLGISGSFRHRETDGNNQQYTTDTDIWDLGASIRRELSPTLTLSLQAGPSFVSTTQTPPSGPMLSTRDSSDISYFAAADLTKEWRRSRFGASYTRSESRGGGTSSSAFVDNLALDFVYNFDRRWKLHLYGGWTQRKEIASVPGIAKLDTTSIRAVSSLTRRLTSRLSIIGRYAFLNQDENGGSGTGSIGQVHTGYLSLRYTFDPVAF